MSNNQNTKLITGFIMSVQTWQPEGNVTVRVKVKTYGDGVISEHKPVAVEFRLTAAQAQAIDGLAKGSSCHFMGTISANLVWTMAARGTFPALPVHAAGAFELGSFQITKVRVTEEANLVFEVDGDKVREARQFMPALSKVAARLWGYMKPEPATVETENGKVDTATGELLEPISA